MRRESESRMRNRRERGGGERPEVEKLVWKMLYIIPRERLATKSPTLKANIKSNGKTCQILTVL